MAISVFDLFKIGIGPSSSHTVGPMHAATLFVQSLKTEGYLYQVASLKIELFGSLGATGKGHGSDRAILLGLEGEQPDTVDISTVESRIATIRSEGRIHLWKEHAITFHEKEHLLFYRRESLPYHSNGMRFTAFDAAKQKLLCRIYYS